MLEALRIGGFDPISIPTIQIRTISPNPNLKQALKFIHVYKWVIFTSVNAVRAVMENTTRARIRQLKHTKIAAIGSKTAAALREYKIKAELIPEKFVGESIADGLGDINGQMILLPRAAEGRDALPEAIRAKGGICVDIPVYHNVLPATSSEQLNALRAGVDVLTFTSPSTVRNFSKICEQHALDPLRLPGDPKVIGIGPVTQTAAAELGYSNVMTPEIYTTDAMIALIGDLKHTMEGNHDR